MADCLIDVGKEVCQLGGKMNWHSPIGRFGELAHANWEV
jgi:hypothetical protein